MPYTKVKEIANYYKARYEKAKALNLTDESPHYAAFIEIEKRYVGVTLASEVMEIVHKRILEGENKGLKKYIYDCVAFIEKQLSLVDKNGKVMRVTLNKNDSDSIKAYTLAKESLNKLENMNYNRIDKGSMCNEILECLYNITVWLIIAREIKFPVDKRRKKQPE